MRNNSVKLEHSDFDKGPGLIYCSEKGLSVLTKILIIILIGGGHFVAHLGYRISDKTRIRT